MISSGFTTDIETADEGVTQLTNFRIESGIVSCPRSLIILTALIVSDYQKIRIKSRGEITSVSAGSIKQLHKRKLLFYESVGNSCDSRLQNKKKSL